MRRSDREIVDRAEIDEIIRGALVCRVAMIRDGAPYLVPLSFGYDDGSLYFHTASEGTKIDCFAADPRVCFEMERDVEVVTHHDLACKWSMTYESVIGSGVIEEIVAPDLKARALNAIARHYSGRDWTIDPPSMERTRVWKLAIESVAGKRSRPKSA